MSCDIPYHLEGPHMHRLTLSSHVLQLAALQSFFHSNKGSYSLSLRNSSREGMFMLVPQLKCFTIQSLRATGKENRGITYYPLKNSGTGLFLCWLKMCRTDRKEPAEPHSFGHFLIIHDFILPSWLPFLYKSPQTENLFKSHNIL